MKLNFEAPVKLTEALLPLLRRTAQGAPTNGRRVAIVNVASTAARVSRPNSGAYSASKFALAGWSDALWAEERSNGVHVGLVLPGFVKTEGFPARELPSVIVSRPEVVAEADFAGSTAAMVDYVGERRPARVVLVTECSMSDNVALQYPDIEFVRPCNLCPHMKRITLANIRRSLARLEHEVTVDPALVGPARRAVERMLQVR